MLLSKWNLKKWRHYCSSSAYRIVYKSGLFDAAFYCSRYPDIHPQHTDPLAHYLETGWREGRYPNSIFDTAWYRETYRHIGDEPPLLHYLRRGWREGCNPTPLFFTSFYLDQYRAVMRRGQNPLAHYLRYWRQGLDPNPLFDGAWYLRRHAELLRTGTNPLADFIHGENRRLQSTHPLFDMDYYLAANPFVREEWLFPVLHFLRHGGDPPEFGFEPCYRPNPYLDLDFYRREYMEGQGTFLEAFHHYATVGVARDLRPDPLFDPRHYRETYGADFAPQESSLAHYLRTGRRTGCLPCPELANLRRRPVISIVTPVYNTEPIQLRRCVLSVLHQTYPNWELWLVDDGSSEAHVRPLMEELGALDDRIRLQFLESNQGISAATNAGAARAKGEYLAFLDHDDELSGDALFRIALAIDREDSDVLYCDEALIDAKSRPLDFGHDPETSSIPLDVFYKPQFNAELLLNHNYITHFLVTRRSLILECGGVDSTCDGAQDYDLVLKLTEKASTITHIPCVLYFWRAHAASTSINHDEKHYADEAGRRALQAALDRRGIRGEALCTEIRFFYRPRRNLMSVPTVSLIVGPETNAKVPCMPEVQGGCMGVSIEFLAPTAECARSAQASGLRIISGKAGEGPAAWRQRAANEARGDVLCFVSGNMHMDNANWLEALLEYSQQANVGMAGGCLTREENPHVHRGSIPDLSRESWRYYVSYVRDVSVQHNGLHCPQNVLAVHEGLCLVDRRRFLDNGGYDPSFATLAFAQLDLCFRLHSRGFVNVFTPYAAGVALAGAESGLDSDTAGAMDRALFRQRWHSQLLVGDPYHNRQLLQVTGIPLDAFLAWYAGEGAAP